MANLVILLFAIGHSTHFASAQIPTAIPPIPLFYGASVFRKCLYETQSIKDALIQSVIRINQQFLTKKGADEPFKQITKIIRITRREMVFTIADTKCSLNDVNLADSFFDSTYIDKCPIPLESKDETKVWICSVRKIPVRNGEVIIGHDCGPTEFGQVKGFNLHPRRDALNETRTGYRSLINCLYLKPAASQALLEGLRLINLDAAISEQKVFQQAATVVKVQLLDEEQNKWKAIIGTMDSRCTKDEEARKLLAKSRLFSLFWDCDFVDVTNDALECSFTITAQKDLDDMNGTPSNIEDVRCTKFAKDSLLDFMRVSGPILDRALRTDNPNTDQ